MIKICSGKKKGRVIKVIQAKDLRPTTSFCREWLFNILRNFTYEEANILDLFGGSGITGMEFLSNGAGGVTFVEKTSRFTNSSKKIFIKYLMMMN